jgi:CRP-like cAMP-binding protein
MSVGKEILTGLGRFTSDDISLFDTKAIKRNFKKDDILLNDGEISKSAFYIVAGEAYQFCYDDIDENIIDLHIEKDWCLNHSSFVTQKPSTAIIKAYSELTVLEFTMTTVHELISISPSFFQLGRVLDQTVSRVRYFDNTNTAGEKYSQLLSARPQLFQKFPLKMIASYLKIAPETLSRIRGKK